MCVHISGHLAPCAKVEEKTPPCSKKCELSYGVNYDQDKHFGESSYSLRKVESIQEEIMTNGPIEAGMTVYPDFVTYKSGKDVPGVHVLL